MKLSPHYKHHNVSINFFFFFFFFLFWDKMSQAILISVFITKLEAFKKRKRRKKKRKDISSFWCHAITVLQESCINIFIPRAKQILRFQWRAHKILVTTSPPFSYNFSRCRCRTKVKKHMNFIEKSNTEPKQSNSVPFTA